jgi:hypothetical protein
MTRAKRTCRSVRVTAPATACASGYVAFIVREIAAAQVAAKCFTGAHALEVLRRLDYYMRAWSAAMALACFRKAIGTGAMFAAGACRRDAGGNQCRSPRAPRTEGSGRAAGGTGRRVE